MRVFAQGQGGVDRSWLNANGLQTKTAFGRKNIVKMRVFIQNQGKLRRSVQMYTSQSLTQSLDKKTIFIRDGMGGCL